MQGERDYQVTPKNYELWHSKLKSKKNVTYKLYPKLNHLFFEGEGPSTYSEYYTPGNIASYVIEDINNWIASQVKMN